MGAVGQRILVQVPGLGKAAMQRAWVELMRDQKILVIRRSEMKDSKDQEENKKVKVEVLKGLFPGEGEIIRKTTEDGTVTCQIVLGKDGRGMMNTKEINTVTEDLEIAVDSVLSRLELLTSKYNDGHPEHEFTTLYNALIRDARLQFAEIFEFINEDIGIIGLQYTHGPLVHDRERCVGACIEPPEEDRSRPICLPEP